MNRMGLVRSGFSVLNKVAPSRVGAVAEWMWFVPPHLPRSDGPLPDGVTPIEIPYRGRKLKGFSVGTGELALLVHGWAGHSRQLMPLAQRLAGAGFQAVSIDLPGHGSDRRLRTDIFQMADALGALTDKVGIPEVLVTHSFGSMVSILALDGPHPRAVFVAPLLTVDTALDGYSAMLDLPSPAVEELRERLRVFCGDAWDQLRVGSSLKWGNDLLIVHDPGDRSTPIELPRELAANQENVGLIEAPGNGHNRILANETVGAQLADFLTSDLSGTRTV